MAELYKDTGLKTVVLVDPNTKQVVNRVIIGWTPPAGVIPVICDEAQIGWTFDEATMTFAPPAPAEEE